MKIVFASTPGQEKRICELIRYFYSEVLPMYFTDEDITEFEKHQVLHTNREHFENFSTLRDAFRVITSLQTLISILEEGSFSDRYCNIYWKNVKILSDFGLYFPFEYNQFFDVEPIQQDYISIYSKAGNSILI
ncbi:YhcU family protein [Mesobacillus zeae]|uniref:YhcU family protein n=1 Tax=Mesobacillus zeae TaxID=1917180 RepID=A0A398B5H0_9BACI|nr:YhcU family protein [Mesobacillus zeae]RID84674.1 hypothetical protein D1970_12370 [Mesobacillus zeae]